MSKDGADVSIGLELTVKGIVSLFAISYVPLYNLFGSHVFYLHQVNVFVGSFLAF